MADRAGSDALALAMHEHFYEYRHTHEHTHEEGRGRLVHAHVHAHFEGARHGDADTLPHVHDRPMFHPGDECIEHHMGRVYRVGE